MYFLLGKLRAKFDFKIKAQNEGLTELIGKK